MHLFNDYLNYIELPLLKELHGLLECKFLDVTMPVITNLCKGGLIWIVIAVVLVMFKKTRKIGLTMGLSLALGLLFCNLCIKPLTMRIRPYDFDPAIKLLIPPESEYSFPSGHAISSIEGSFGIFLYNKKYGALAIVFALMICFSRLYLMMHYFTDVLVSVMLGILFSIIAYNIVKLISKKTELI